MQSVEALVEVLVTERLDDAEFELVLLDVVSSEVEVF